MELKSYQKAVLTDLENYLEILTQKKNLETTWEEYHGEGLPRYRDRIKGVPNVCLKIPTGGGKTFLACASLKKIFDVLPSENKFVVWLVPNDAILTQTTAALTDTNHAYRKKINEDFQSKVIVYSKEMLLQGQNFSSATIPENLSICVMSYASIRIDSRKKDARKVHQENGALETVADYLGTENTALISILQKLNPVVIVDESHNANSDLSVEMLENLNPRFILELTATPKNFSNIISVVSAETLNTAGMIKLPVLVYNPFDKDTLIQSVISFRNNLEEMATDEEKRGGHYVRPIVLFQAQPDTNDDSETFEKIKQNLIRAGIKEKEIAIKTANINEIGTKDLSSRDCPIRYIITINALKEGWDCPFAYVLASLANKNSQTDVEQLVGRILRQPNTIKSQNDLLNSAYVFTCSADFNGTVRNIVKKLNNDGISEKDIIVPVKPDEMNLFEDAEEQIKQHKDKQKGSQNFGGTSRGENLKTYKIKSDFQSEIDSLLIPQFFKKVPRNSLIEDDLFATGETVEKFLTPENLSENFNLCQQDKTIKFDVNIAEINVENGKFVSSQLSLEEAQKYQEMLDMKTPEDARKYFIMKIFDNLRKWKRGKFYKPQDLMEFVKFIVEHMTANEFENLNLKTLPAYIKTLKEKITQLEDNYREKQFKDLVKSKKIICKQNYKFEPCIQLNKSEDTIRKSLYEAEGVMNDLEVTFISKIAGLNNIRWWHRIIERKDFVLNGFINHYPDFILRTTNGSIILVETKGDDRDNSDSRQKLELGNIWEGCAGNNYRYFMAFKNESELNDSYALNNFLNLVSEL